MASAFWPPDIPTAGDRKSSYEMRSDCIPPAGATVLAQYKPFDPAYEASAQDFGGVAAPSSDGIGLSSGGGGSGHGGVGHGH
jgi:hypothetical protein